MQYGQAHDEPDHALESAGVVDERRDNGHVYRRLLARVPGCHLRGHCTAWYPGQMVHHLLAPGWFLS
ncbi:hypothetical protein EV182_004590, partial [Spiromyces aspiralis]